MTDYDLDNQEEFAISQAEFNDLKAADFVKCINPFDGYEIILPVCIVDEQYQEVDFGPHVIAEKLDQANTTSLVKFMYIMAYEEDGSYVFTYMVSRSSITPQLGVLPQSQADGNYV